MDHYAGTRFRFLVRKEDRTQLSFIPDKYTTVISTFCSESRMAQIRICRLFWSTFLQSKTIFNERNLHEKRFLCWNKFMTVVSGLVQEDQRREWTSGRIVGGGGWIPSSARHWIARFQCFAPADLFAISAGIKCICQVASSESWIREIYRWCSVEQRTEKIFERKPLALSLCGHCWASLCRHSVLVPSHAFH